MSRTSISCSTESKQQLQQLKRDDETWDDMIQRVVATVQQTQEEPHDSGANRNGADAPTLASIQDQLETVQTTQTQIQSNMTAGGAPSENELREIVRMEVQNVVESVLANRH